jgi:Arc/MetJ family transcription regulator
MKLPAVLFLKMGARDTPSVRCLMNMYKAGIIMHMRTTINIDDDLLREAGRLAGVSEKTSLVRLGLEALVEKESARRLARLGGSEPQLVPIPRRRPGRNT